MSFVELKARQSVMWGSGPYEELSAHHQGAIDHLLGRLGPLAGRELLDVATGTGELARPAAAAGALVTAIDLAPVLIETAKRTAASAGLTLTFEIGDAEHLPYGDGRFDIVASTFGVMFTPSHAAAAAELARVTRRGGRLGLTTWRGDGGVGALLGTMKPFQPPPPAPAPDNPFDWGRKDHVEELLGEHFALEFDEGDAVQVAASGEEMWDLLLRTYGPTKALAAPLDDTRRRDLEAAVVAFYESHRTDDQIRFSREYLLVTGTRR